MQLLVVENSQPIHRLIATCLREHNCEISHRALPHDPERFSELPDTEAVFVGAYQPLRLAIAVIGHYAQRVSRPSIVALTPEPQVTARAQLLTAGADYVIEMPFLSYQIREMFELVLRDRAAR